MITAQYERLHVHVNAPNREVIKRAHRMLSPVGKSRAQRDVRHGWLRAILAEHMAARELYRYVMR